MTEEQCTALAAELLAFLGGEAPDRSVRIFTHSGGHTMVQCRDPRLNYNSKEHDFNFRRATISFVLAHAPMKLMYLETTGLGNLDGVGFDFIDKNKWVADAYKLTLEFVASLMLLVPGDGPVLEPIRVLLERIGYTVDVDQHNGSFEKALCASLSKDNILTQNGVLFEKTRVRTLPPMDFDDSGCPDSHD